MFFVPRWEEEDYRTSANVQFQPEELEYFTKLRGLGIKLDVEQMKWYVLQKRTLKQKMFQEYPSTFEEAFMLITEGSYFEHELNTAREQGRISIQGYDPNLQVHTARDL